MNDPNSEEKHIIVYMDILGFSEYVLQNPQQNSIDILHKLRDGSLKIRNSIQHLSTVGLENNKSQSEIESFQKSVKYHLLSDSVIISIQYHDDQFDVRFYFLCQLLIHFQVEMFGFNLPVRGGVSIGWFYSDENIIVGSALVKAAEIEKKVAKYQRIVIDNEIMESFPPDQTLITNKLALTNEDGVWYLDIFKFYSGLKRLLKTNLIQVQSTSFKNMIYDFDITLGEYIISVYEKINNSKVPCKGLEEKLEWLEERYNKYSSL